MKQKMLSSYFASTLAIALAFFPADAQKKEAPKLSDAEIASVAVAANQIDIQAAQLAQENRGGWP